MSRLVMAISLILLVVSGCGEDEKPKQPAEPQGKQGPATAPEEPAGEEPAAGEPSAEETGPSAGVVAVASSLTALAKGDVDAALSAFSGDATWLTVGAGTEPIVGKDGISAHLEAWRKAFSDFAIRPKVVIDAVDVIAVEALVGGTHDGTFSGVAATGIPVEMAALLVFDYDAGHIAAVTFYANATTLLQQIGAARGEPAALPSYPETPEIIAARGPDDEGVDEVSEALLGRLFPFYRELADGKKGAMEAFCGPSLISVQVSTGRRLRGVAANEAHLAALRKAFSDLEIRVDRAAGAGDHAVAQMTIAGTQDGALGTIPASKKRVLLHAADVLRFEHGKVVEVRSYASQPELAAQLAK